MSDAIVLGIGFVVIATVMFAFGFAFTRLILWLYMRSVRKKIGRMSISIVRNPGNGDFASSILPVEPVTDTETGRDIEAGFRKKFGFEIVTKSLEEPVCRKHCPL